MCTFPDWKPEHCVASTNPKLLWFFFFISTHLHLHIGFMPLQMKCRYGQEDEQIPVWAQILGFIFKCINRSPSIQPLIKNLSIVWHQPTSSYEDFYFYNSYSYSYSCSYESYTFIRLLSIWTWIWIIIRIKKIKILITWCWLMSHNAQILNQRLYRWWPINTGQSVTSHLA